MRLGSHNIVCVIVGLLWFGAEVAAAQQFRPPVRRPTQNRAQYRPRPVYRQPPPRPVANNQPKPKDVVNTTDYVVTFAEKGKVRMMEEPLEFDEKGNRKKFTPAELREFKGDTPAEQRLAGYKAVYADLRVGDTVKVYLSTFKPNPPKKEAERKTEKNAEEKKGADDTSKKEKEAPEEEEAEDGRWVAAGVFEGTITKLDKSGSSNTRFTVRVTTHRVEMQGPNAPKPAPAKKPAAAQEINPEKQATVIIVAKRPEGGLPEMVKKK